MSQASPTRIAICVPARDEAASLPELFAAMERLDRTDVDLRLCLLLDSCRDASVAVARDHARRASMPVAIERMEQSDANAGRARHAAMLLGMVALNGTGLLLSTDADSVPDAQWVQAMVAGCRNAEVVAGKVVRTVTRPHVLQDRIEAYYDRLHAMRRIVDPVAWEAAATHPFASGANLALSVDDYARLGGFPPLSAGEDARLVDDAARAGMRVQRDAAGIVHTSDRRSGRVADGLAGSLSALDRTDTAVEVAHPADMVWQYRRHAAARSAFAAGNLGSFAATIGLTTDHAVGVARDCPNAEAFAMRVVPVPPAGMRQVELIVAEAALSALSAARRAA